jgi:hypothetical protein
MPWGRTQAGSLGDDPKRLQGEDYCKQLPLEIFFAGSIRITLLLRDMSVEES